MGRHLEGARVALRAFCLQILVFHALQIHRAHAEPREAQDQADEHEARAPHGQLEREMREAVGTHGRLTVRTGPSTICT